MPYHHAERILDRDDSMAILKGRYARGELSREEFEKMKQVLGR